MVLPNDRYLDGHESTQEGEMLHHNDPQQLAQEDQLLALQHLAQSNRRRHLPQIDQWNWHMTTQALRTRRTNNHFYYGLEASPPMHSVPNKKGRELMASGRFGSGVASMSQNGGRNRSRQELLLRREMGMYISPGQRRSCFQAVVRSCLPENSADFIIENGCYYYVGQFSEDGNLFYSAAQDMVVRLFDTSDPFDWKYIKSAPFVGGQWAITDASLSPDNRFLAFTSISSVVHIADTTPESRETQKIEFADGQAHSMRPGAGIMSVRFSRDGKELLVGSKDRFVYLYDITAECPILRLMGHTNEVNAVCYADTDSPHLIYSGSDDSTIKVWDRRSMAGGDPVGVFTGHTEGITFVHSKGDGRYVLSNGKDQQMKLWDLRSMMDPSDFQQMPRTDYSTDFDYRHELYKGNGTKHPYDKSLVTYEGHSVHRTLIRCYFSPPVSTGSQYVYTGSADGKVKIYNIDATLASEIDVHKATKVVRPKTNCGRPLYSHWFRSYHKERTCVRDVSWHPTAPVFTATSFQGDGLGKGTISVHSWRGADKELREDEREGYTPRVYGAEMGDTSESERDIREANG